MLSEGHHHAGFIRSRKSSSDIVSEKGRSPPLLKAGVVRTSLVSSVPQGLTSFLCRSHSISRHGPATTSSGRNAGTQVPAQTYGESARQEVNEDLYEDVRLAPLISRSSLATKGASQLDAATPPVSRSQSLENLRKMLDSVDNVGKKKKYFEERSKTIAHAERHQHPRHDQDRHRHCHSRHHRCHHHECQQHQVDDDPRDPSASADSSSLSSFSDAHWACSTLSEHRRSNRLTEADLAVEARSWKSPSYCQGCKSDSPARRDPEPQRRFTCTAGKASPDKLREVKHHDVVSPGRKGLKANRHSTLRDDGSHRDISPAHRSPQRGRSLRRKDEHHGLNSGYSKKTFDITSQTSSEEPMRFNRKTSVSSARKGCSCATLRHSESEDNIVSADSSRKLAKTHISVYSSSNQSLGNVSKERRRCRPLSVMSRMRRYPSSSSQDSESDYDTRLAHHSPSVRRGPAARSERHGVNCSPKVKSASVARAFSQERLTTRLKLRDKINQHSTVFDSRSENEEADVSWQYPPLERDKQNHQQSRQDDRCRQREERHSRNLFQDTSRMPVASLPHGQRVDFRPICQGLAKDPASSHRHRAHY